MSQLKKALGPNCQVQTDLPSPDTQFAVPYHVLQRRLCHHGTAVVPQGLIHWSGQPESLATWEDLEELHQRFPRAPAWGQAGFQGRGSVSCTPGDTANCVPSGTATTEGAVSNVTDGPATEEEVQPIKRVRQASKRYPSAEWHTSY